MLPISKVEPLTKTASPEIYAMSKIIKVEAMHRVSDIFGPISTQNTSSPMQTWVLTLIASKLPTLPFFADLAEAIGILTPKIGQAASTNFKKSDLVYGGDYGKWVRLPTHFVYALHCVS
jgi:hypothetical protein